MNFDEQSASGLSPCETLVFHFQTGTEPKKHDHGPSGTRNRILEYIKKKKKKAKKKKKERERNALQMCSSFLSVSHPVC